MAKVRVLVSGFVDVEVAAGAEDWDTMDAADVAVDGWIESLPENFHIEIDGAEIVKK